MTSATLQLEFLIRLDVTLMWIFPVEIQEFLRPHMNAQWVNEGIRCSQLLHLAHTCLQLSRPRRLLLRWKCSLHFTRLSCSVILNVLFISVQQLQHSSESQGDVNHVRSVLAHTILQWGLISPNKWNHPCGFIMSGLFLDAYLKKTERLDMALASYSSESLLGIHRRDLDSRIHY